MQDGLTFPDLVILTIIRENSDAGHGVVYEQIAALGNRWLREKGVPANYSPPIPSGSESRQRMILKLLRLRMIERVGIRKGFRVTARAEELLDRYGDDWRKYPLLIPVVDGALAYDQAIPAEAFREAL